MSKTEYYTLLAVLQRAPGWQWALLVSVRSLLSPPCACVGWADRAGRGWVGCKSLYWGRDRISGHAMMQPSPLFPQKKFLRCLFGRSTVCWLSSLLLTGLPKKNLGVLLEWRIYQGASPRWKHGGMFKPSSVSLLFCTLFCLVLLIFLVHLPAHFACCFRFLLLLPWSFSSRKTIHSLYSKFSFNVSFVSLISYKGSWPTSEIVTMIWKSAFK